VRRGHIQLAPAALHEAVPRYELRMRTWGAGDDEIEVWQVPSPATPHVRSPIRVAGLRGRNLELVQHRMLKRLTSGGVKLGPQSAMALLTGEPATYPINEHLALVLGLLFRTLAPMSRRESMLRVAEGIEAMGQEEAAYWMGMAMHRVNPRRVLSALRMLLTDPARRADDRR
jgi:hypothetical protein